jgi:hypothetical protein
VGQAITEDRKLLRDFGVMNNNYGDVIGINDDIMTIGASRVGSNRNAAYLIDASTGEQVDKLLANDGETQDQYGRSVAIENGALAIGA